MKNRCLVLTAFLLFGCEREESQKQLDDIDVALSFPNQKLLFRSEGGGRYEIFRYGNMSYIRIADKAGPSRLHLNLGISEFENLWNSFEVLSNRENYRNQDDRTKNNSEFYTVLINTNGGMEMTYDRSYSIPRNIQEPEYQEWFSNLKVLLRQYESEQDAALKSQP